MSFLTLKDQLILKFKVEAELLWNGPTAPNGGQVQRRENREPPTLTLLFLVVRKPKSLVLPKLQQILLQLYHNGKFRCGILCKGTISFGNLLGYP